MFEAYTGESPGSVVLAGSVVKSFPKAAPRGVDADGNTSVHPSDASGACETVRRLSPKDKSAVKSSATLPLLTKENTGVVRAVGIDTVPVVCGVTNGFFIQTPMRRFARRR